MKKNLQKLLVSGAVLLLVFICTDLSAKVFTIADGDVAALKAAITEANSNGQPDTIHLAPYGTYTLTTVEDNFTGDMGLPMITDDGAVTNFLQIFGNGSTLTRDLSAPKFRLMYSLYGELYINDLHFTNGELSSGSNSGGALAVNGGHCHISNCTFSNNKTSFSGGAIHISVPAITIISNSTFYGNTAPFGSAIYKFGDAEAYINSCTISGNTATGPTSGGTVDNSSTTKYIYFANSIVTNNTITAAGGAEVNGGIVGQGGNIIGSANASLVSVGNPNSSGDYVGTVAAPYDAKVNTLADNGGFTKTVSLQAGSMAINKGDVANLITLDQRGYARVGVTDAGAFEYGATSASPVIATTGLNKTMGPIGTVLTISGANMSGITQIKFSGSAAVTSGFTNNTATSVTVTVPAGTTTGKVTVTTAAGTSAASLQTFTIGIPKPVIASTGLSVTSGPIGTVLTITGTDFDNITQIKFQGATAVTTGFTNNTSTSVTVTVPAGTTSGKITVTTTGGTSALSTQSFTVTAPLPVIASSGLSVDHGTIGSSLTISGTNFSGITKVSFQNADVTSGFTNNTSTSVTVTVPTDATTGQITVTTAAGTSALSTQTFTIDNPMALKDALLTDMQIYPNPVEETCFIQLNKNMDLTTATIYSATGEEVKQVELNTLKTEIDTRDLSAGIFILTVKNTAGESASYRLVRN
ncbi:MAG: choice-of-anchor Q domain-containing protein [Cytophaga sp.]|uniref:choice-of-anchor Q domain-containing protein n=1 Tax=Cytophaga sp. TaxID=29535 RepID=UPI003F7CDC4C